MVGLALAAALPTASPVSSASALVGGQAFARSEPVGQDLGADAIAVHALIEFVFAPQRANIEPPQPVEPEAVEPEAVEPEAVEPEETAFEAETESGPAAATVETATAAPKPAIAQTPTSSHAARGQAALARIPVSPASVGFTIEFLPGRAGYGGLTFPDTRRIEIYVNGGWSDAHLAHVVAHEIGHAVDMARNSRADHDRWRAARGIAATTRWWADPYTSDFATPGGDFAECFAAWAVGSPSTRSQFGSCTGTGALVSELVWG